MSTGSYHHANLKQKLIDVGADLILREGVEALSLRRLAAECGVSHAAPYKHFKGKEAIISAILEQAELAFAQKLTAAMDAMQHATPKERLVKQGVAYVQFMVENPDRFRLLFLSGSLSLHPSVDLTDVLPSDTSLGIFYQAAVAYLDYEGADVRNRTTDILAMWAMVYGLAVMLVNRTMFPGQQENYQSIVEHILSHNLMFP